jgi:transcriptional regulator with GAF, ATPase, and Fis domain
VLAGIVHKKSKRSKSSLIIVDCAGLTETLFESELFGHEKGSFTGAYVEKKGLVEMAHGGTLFLDEIGEIPLNQQVKLLRLIETSTFRKVGGLEVLRANFRLVCATHRDLNGW